MDGVERNLNPVKDLFTMSDGRLSQPILSKEGILHAQTAVPQALCPSDSHHRYQKYQQSITKSEISSIATNSLH
jgi:hypothetical protein